MREIWQLESWDWRMGESLVRECWGLKRGLLLVDLMENEEVPARANVLVSGFGINVVRVKF